VKKNRRGENRLIVRKHRGYRLPGSKLCIPITIVKYIKWSAAQLLPWSMERKVRILSLEFLWILTADLEFRTSLELGDADGTSCRRACVRKFAAETAVSEFIATAGRTS